MANSTLVEKLTHPALAITLSLILVGGLFGLLSVSLDSSTSGNFHWAMLMLNSVGLTVLILLVVLNLFVLRKQYKSKILGSRLTTRLVGTFFLVTVIPLLLVYYIAVQFLSAGIDSWFDVRVEQAIDDALLLGQTTLQSLQQGAIEDIQSQANQIRDIFDRNELARALDSLRQSTGYQELSVFTQNGTIIASSSEDARVLVPETPDDTILSQVRLGQSYSSIEPASDQNQLLRVAAPIYSRVIGRASRVLHAKIALPLRYAKLASSVDQASNQYQQMVFSREPIRENLALTLSVISLVALLLSILCAIYLSRRLVAPLGELAKGTRAVAQGDYSTELSVTSQDELGVLVGSFNDMTSEIREAQKLVRKSKDESDRHSAYLEMVLKGLSSGVLAFDENDRLTTYNKTAEEILDTELASWVGKGLSELVDDRNNLQPFYETISSRFAQESQDWQDEITILGPRGRQVLITRGALLATDTSNHSGSVIVFDDVTGLIQAQKNAAWGEVAKRLAHEIKNPLTPIQLSAERIRQKFMDQVKPAQRDVLDRATRTIVQQVESMKDMVNDFSSYAQPVKAELSETKLPDLIRDVAELHHRDDEALKISFDIDDSIKAIQSNPSALRQVLNNLIINAKHALSEIDKPVITLGLQKAEDVTGDYVDLSVEDNGTGIPEEMRESLFDPYVSSKSKGSGLGLAIVKRIVEEHGGTVWAEVGQSNGTRFVVRLPSLGHGKI
ncbi:MAG: HAMP domain-containing protein [Proteobacteria bacterium]|jgi:nitrogen fixation/metabolism regulation signal transduction histidine kinase|nr:HAMP domain-containing protein [Pseudomonadota bacterium]